MRLAIAAALALTAGSSLHAQAAPAVDYSTAIPLEGSWVYSTVTAGSAVTFANLAAQPQVTISCTRPTRSVTIAKPAAGAAPFLFVWTSAQSRNLPASYNPATARLSATLSAYDPLLDGIAFSRGRMAFGISGQPAVVVPAWAEAARVVEDCRV
jgi:hypothetical protein